MKRPRKICPILGCEQPAPPWRGVQLYPMTSPLAWTLKLGDLHLWHWRRKPAPYLPGRRSTLYRIDDSRLRRTIRPSRRAFVEAIIRQLYRQDAPARIPEAEWQAMLAAVARSEPLETHKEEAE